eukprot:CAMPEP_0178640478 /NCGR_PEP_ID=MMETSP0698-20121128/16040_1 /TAXON_ID=265572 /ORGANISM="Extubocellulus spinifer, Strain CCMP396" /LENGTH=505 /DNA_ID=CAMNT_0020280925 /DNA_START=309 /DNA_END=1823 /DNA_ORIENTATION=-
MDDRNQRATRKTATTTRTTSAEGRRSASQILATALRANKNSDKRLSSSRGARFRNRGASHDDVIHDNGLSTTASSNRTERRASYNDGTPIPSNAASSTTGSRRPSETRRASVSSEISEPSEEEQERFRAAAGKYAQSVARSTGRRMMTSQKSRRRTSYDDALACAWEPFVKASSRNGTRRASYNDALSDSDDDNGCKYGRIIYQSVSRSTGRRSSPEKAGRRSYDNGPASSLEPVMNKASARKVLRRASYDDALSDSDDDDEVGQNYDQSVSRSACRRLSSDEAPVVKKASARRILRRASYNDVLSDSDDDDDDVKYRDCDCCDNRILPRRRVSFLVNEVESIHEIPTISRQEKREMFYRKKDIKQFRMDLQFERALVLADLRKTSLPHLRRRSSNTSSIEGKEENKSGKKMLASTLDETQQANEQIHILANNNNQIQQELTGRENFSTREVATAALAEPMHAFLSDSFITGSEVTAAATAAEAVTSPPGVKKKPQAIETLFDPA